MDHSVYATSSPHSFIGCVDNGVNILVNRAAVNKVNSCFVNYHLFV